MFKPTFHPITFKQYDDWLGAVPPRCFEADRYLIGEPFDHDPATGLPRYQACFILGHGPNAKAYASNQPMTVRDFRTLTPAHVEWGAQD